MYQHLGPESGYLNYHTPDRARDLACWTVFTAAWRGEVLNGRERGLQDCLLREHGIGRHAGGPRRERALEENIWRRMSARSKFERLDAFGHRDDIAERCHASPKLTVFETIKVCDGFPLWLARVILLLIIISKKGPNLPWKSRNCIEKITLLQRSI